MRLEAPGTLVPERLRGPRLLLASLALALAYYVSGRLGLLLAIPPGYATAVWPASGIALAGIVLAGWRAWPGVWLGSFAINVWTGLDASSTAALLKSLPVPAAIAGGAALQACLGAALIRRWVGYRNLLEQELGVVWILLLGGPVACLANATLGVLTLQLAGLVAPGAALFNWWTWWVGDSIGVLIFAPLVLVWTAQPRAVWLRRQLLASAPLVLMFALVVWLFLFASRQEQARVEARFAEAAEQLAEHLRDDLAAYPRALHAVAGLYAGSESVSRGEFEAFTAIATEGLPAIQALGWNPRVPAAQREAFEQRLLADGLPPNGIREGAPAGLRAAEARAEYFPVQYLAPLPGNEPAIGYDIASEPVRAQALARARDTGMASASGRLTLVQAPGEAAVLLFLPLFERGAPRATVDDRRRHLQGYASAVLVVSRLASDVFARAEAQGLQARLVDHSAGDAPLWPPDAAPAATPAFERRIDLPVADRVWQLQLRLPGEWLVAHRSWPVWTLLASGMLFTGLLGMFLLVIIGRSTRVEQLVEQRTAELQRLNRDLNEAVARSDRLERESRERAEALGRSNRELEQFAYAVSHDLQAPLRNIVSFAGLLSRRYAERMDEDGREFLKIIGDCAGQMRELIEDLLELSRVNAQRAKMAPVPAGEPFAAACELLRTDIQNAGAQVEHGELPTVRGDRRLLTLLFQNLIDNGIKFRREDLAPRVHVTAEPGAHGFWRFAVIDNGIGIPADSQGQLFQIFKRLHTSDQYPGTGVGLALCRKIVLLHGGEIWVESTPGQGSTFWFTLPGAEPDGAP